MHFVGMSAACFCVPLRFSGTRASEWLRNVWRVYAVPFGAYEQINSYYGKWHGANTIIFLLPKAWLRHNECERRKPAC